MIRDGSASLSAQKDSPMKIDESKVSAGIRLVIGDFLKRQFSGTAAAVTKSFNW